MKKIITTFVFICLLLLILINLDKILKIKTPETNLDQYLKQDNIDLIFIGTSRIRNSISPMYIWNKYRVISYGLGSSGQDYTISSLLTQLSIKRNKPKIIVIDANFISNYASKRRDLLNFIPLTYRVQYSMHLFNEPLKEINVFYNYHTRWKNINKNDFISKTYFKGLGEYQHIVARNIIKDEYVNYKTTISKDIIELVRFMQNIEKKYSTKIIFIKLPNTKDNIWFDKEFSKLAREYGFVFLDYNKLKNDIKLDYNKDFIDTSHINIYGGQKVIDHLIPYLIKYYQLPTYYNDKNYVTWDNDYIKYAREINTKEVRFIKSFSDWKKQAFYDNYTVMLSANGDVLKNMPEQLKKDLKSFGLKKYNTDKANMRYAAIIDDNKVFFEEISNKPVTYKGRMKNIVNLLVSSDGKATINVSGKPRSKNKYGLNFVIYDKVNREIVDSIWIDPRKPDVVRR